MRVVTAAQMRAIDAAAVARDGEIALMRAAGDAIAQLIDRYACGDGPVVALAGDGNNGGAAYAALAAYAGARPRIVFGNLEARGSDARRDARARARIAGVEERPLPAVPDVLGSASLLLDGVLGVNARLPLDAGSGALAEAMNRSGVPILALDLPTGIDPTTGAVDERAVQAVAAIALGRPKLGCFLDPGRDHVGALWCAPLGMRDEDAAGVDEPAVDVLDPAGFIALLPRRAAESDKRASGAPLIVAGSTQFPGAAILAALGAARAGAGHTRRAMRWVAVTKQPRSLERAVARSTSLLASLSPSRQP